MARNLKMSCAGFAALALSSVLLFLPGQTAKAQSASNSTANQTAQSQNSPQAANASAAKPNLVGTWTLNEKQSDDPRAKMQAAMNANGDQGDSGETNPGRMGRRRGRGPGAGGGGMMRQFSQLTITQTDKGLNIAGATGRLIATTVPQSNSDQSAQDNGGGMMMRMQPAEAKWQDNQLVATRDMFGGTITRTFEFSPDGKQLYVTTKIENQRFSQPVTYRFVYDPGKADNSSSQ
jgi:hypothetical protein